MHPTGGEWLQQPSPAYDPNMFARMHAPMGMLPGQQHAPMHDMTRLHADASEYQARMSGAMQTGLPSQAAPVEPQQTVSHASVQPSTDTDMPPAQPPSLCPLSGQPAQTPTEPSVDANMPPPAPVQPGKQGATDMYGLVEQIECGRVSREEVARMKDAKDDCIRKAGPMFNDEARETTRTEDRDSSRRTMPLSR